MNKRKQSQNTIVYWWNEFLFARYFEYETSLTPEELTQAFEAIAHERQGWIWGLEKTAEVTMHPNDKGLDFDVQSRRRRLFDPIGITTARTLGTATVDSATGNLHVQGDVKLGRFIQIFFFFYIAAIVMSVSPLLFNAELSGMLIGLLPIAIIGIVFMSIWYRIYTDRNNLAALIEDAVFTGKAKRAGNRLSDSETDVQNLQVSGADEQRNRKQNL